MAVTRRTWVGTGSQKNSGQSVTTTTITGTDYPQVGDLIIACFAFDNISATTPDQTSLTVSGTGAIGTVTYVNPDANSGTAAAAAKLGFAYATVTQAFVSGTQLVVQHNTGNTAARAVAAIALTGQGTVPAGSTLAGTGSPIQYTPTIPAGSRLVWCLATENNAAETAGGALTSVAQANTTGGGAASNVSANIGVSTTDNSQCTFTAGGDWAYWLGVIPAVSTGQGSASGSQTITGSASGSRQSAGSATGSQTITGSAVGSRPAAGTASGTVQQTGSATGTNAGANQGSASGSQTITGSASGSRQSAGTASGSVTMTATAAGSRESAGTGSGSVTMSATATGSAAHEGSSSAQQTITGTASGTTNRAGTASGSVTITGVASGNNEGGGSASGAVSLTGSAVGSRMSQGSASGSVQTSGSATGTAIHLGYGVGGVQLIGTAIGFTDRSGTATGQFAQSGVATGAWGGGLPGDGKPVADQTLTLIRSGTSELTLEIR